MDQIVIRPYERRDRSRVREICYVTGYMGDPVDWLWGDAESFANLFTSYYTDGEPESALVLERDGTVEGYLLGCVDTQRAWNESSLFIRQVLRRGIAFRRGTAGFVWRSFADVLVDQLHGRGPPSPVHDGRWPAHLHIDLMPSVRGRGLGASLMRRWLERLGDMDVAGCHVQTLAENRRAIAAFESVGFERLGKPALAPGLRSPGGLRHSIQLMVYPMG